MRISPNDSVGATLHQRLHEDSHVTGNSLDYFVLNNRIVLVKSKPDTSLINALWKCFRVLYIETMRGKKADKFSIG